MFEISDELPNWSLSAYTSRSECSVQMPSSWSSGLTRTLLEPVRLTGMTLKDEL